MNYQLINKFICSILIKFSVFLFLLFSTYNRKQSSSLEPRGYLVLTFWRAYLHSTLFLLIRFYLLIIYYSMNSFHYFIFTSFKNSESSSRMSYSLFSRKLSLRILPAFFFFFYFNFLINSKPMLLELVFL